MTTCETCDGHGELVRCRPDGCTGCSHQNDEHITCPTCEGEGEVQ